MPYIIYSRKIGTGSNQAPASYQEAVLNLNPVGYWRLGESSGTVAADSSGNGYDLDYISSPTLGVTGLLTNDADTAVRLDGSTQYLNSNTVHGPLNILGDLSFGAVVNMDTLSTGNVIISSGGLGEAESVNFSYYAVINPNGLVTYFHESGAGTNTTVNFSHSALGTSTQYNIMITRDVTLKEVKLYINGALADTKTYANNPTGGTSNEIWVGELQSNPNWHFDGVMDEVVVFDSKLTDQQIIDLHDIVVNGPPVTGNPNTVLLLHAEDYTDSSQSNHTVTNTGTTIGAGQFTDAFQFNSNDQVAVDPSEDFNLGTGDFTIDMWLRPTGTGSQGGGTGIIGNNDFNIDEGWSIFLSSVSGGSIVQLVTNDGGERNLNFAFSLLPDQWQHLAVTRESGTLRAFRNGTQQFTSTFTWNFPNNSRDLLIGRGGSRQTFAGSIDEVRILKGEAAYTSNFSVPTAPYADP